MDSTSVYWVAGVAFGTGPGAIVKAPLGGGAVVTLVSGLENPSSIAVDATSVYWGDIAVSGEDQNGVVLKVTPK